MNISEDLLLQEIVQTIVREADPEQVILFGSRARDDARADSDIDLLIVEKAPFSLQRSRRKEAARLYYALRKLPIAKDLLLYSQEEFDHLKHQPQHVVGRAQREGKVLHVRI
jgi:predicted nucleotidyltransferase